MREKYHKINLLVCRKYFIKCSGSYRMLYIVCTNVEMTYEIEYSHVRLGDLV